MGNQTTAKIISGHPAEHADISTFLTVQVRGTVLGTLCPEGSKLYLELIQKKDIEKATKSRNTVTLTKVTPTTNYLQADDNHRST